ncbi:MAG TPA: VOC family protein [Steroidobacteraceae bacterium]|nr:VOC family protein [Steroidobacteraceae bacterium]
MIDHIGLVVSDLARAKAFYDWALRPTADSGADAVRRTGADSLSGWRWTGMRPHACIGPETLPKA